MVNPGTRTVKPRRVLLTACAVLVLAGCATKIDKPEDDPLRDECFRHRGDVARPECPNR